MPGDVLQHHDGIIHHQSGGNDQRHQRQVVQRKAQQVHDRKAADQRHRYGKGGNHRRPTVAQKQQHHHDHQRGGYQQRALGLAQGGLDHRRAVHRHMQLGRGWQHCLQRRQFLADGGNGFDDVGVGLAVDDQQHRLLIVEKAAVVAVFHIVADPRHIAQAQDGTVLFADDQRRIVPGLVQLVVGLDLPVAIALLHLSIGALQVSTGNGLPNLVQRHAVVLQQTRLQLDPHRR